jgi:hypothetical protein
MKIFRASPVFIFELLGIFPLIFPSHTSAIRPISRPPVQVLKKPVVFWNVPKSCKIPSFSNQFSKKFSARDLQWGSEHFQLFPDLVAISSKAIGWGPTFV